MIEVLLLIMLSCSAVIDLTRCHNEGKIGCLLDEPRNEDGKQIKSDEFRVVISDTQLEREPTVTSGSDLHEKFENLDKKLNGIERSLRTVDAKYDQILQTLDSKSHLTDDRKLLTNEDGENVTFNLMESLLRAQRSVSSSNITVQKVIERNEETKCHKRGSKLTIKTFTDEQKYALNFLNRMRLLVLPATSNQGQVRKRQVCNTMIHRSRNGSTDNEKKRLIQGLSSINMAAGQDDECDFKSVENMAAGQDDASSRSNRNVTYNQDHVISNRRKRSDSSNKIEELLNMEAPVNEFALDDWKFCISDAELIRMRNVFQEAEEANIEVSKYDSYLRFLLEPSADQNMKKQGRGRRISQLSGKFSFQNKIKKSENSGKIAAPKIDEISTRRKKLLDTSKCHKQKEMVSKLMQNSNYRTRREIQGEEKAPQGKICTTSNRNRSSGKSKNLFITNSDDLDNKDQLEKSIVFSKKRMHLPTTHKNLRLLEKSLKANSSYVPESKIIVKAMEGQPSHALKSRRSPSKICSSLNCQSFFTDSIMEDQDTSHLPTMIKRIHSPKSSLIEFGETSLSQSSSNLPLDVDSKKINKSHKNAKDVKKRIEMRRRRICKFLGRKDLEMVSSYLEKETIGKRRKRSCKKLFKFKKPKLKRLFRKQSTQGSRVKQNQKRTSSEWVKTLGLDTKKLDSIVAIDNDDIERKGSKMANDARMTYSPLMVDPITEKLGAVADGNLSKEFQLSEVKENLTGNKPSISFKSHFASESKQGPYPSRNSKKCSPPTLAAVQKRMRHTRYRPRKGSPLFELISCRGKKNAEQTVESSKNRFIAGSSSASGKKDGHIIYPNSIKMSSKKLFHCGKQMEDFIKALNQIQAPVKIASILQLLQKDSLQHALPDTGNVPNPQNTSIQDQDLFQFILSFEQKLNCVLETLETVSRQIKEECSSNSNFKS